MLLSHSASPMFLLPSSLVVITIVLLNGGNHVKSVSGLVNGKDAYEECDGRGALCFGMPTGCIATRNCHLLMTAARISGSEGTVEFKMVGTIIEPTTNNGLGGGVDGVSLEAGHWFAMGLSRDQLMGDDSVTECLIQRDGRAEMRQTWNQGKSNRPLAGGLSGVTQVGQVTFQDGYLTCRWRRAARTFVNGQTFDIINERNYVHLAKGPLSGPLKRKHNAYLTSETAIHFDMVGQLASSGLPRLIKLHGSLMIGVWIAIASIGMLIARHYKSEWDGKLVCGVKIWFTFHRALMASSFGIIIAATVSIFMHVGEFRLSWHSAMGALSTTFATLNVLGGLLRPGLDSPNRSLFNWAHFLGGNTAHLFAVCAILTSSALLNVGASYVWLIALAIVFHLLAHVTLQVHSSSKGKIVDTNGHSNGNGTTSHTHPNGVHAMQLDKDTRRDSDGFAKTSSLKMSILIVYSISVVGFALALIFHIVPDKT